MNQIQAKKQSRKFGRYPMDVIHRIQPSARQCDHAATLCNTNTHTKAKYLTKLSIPLFSIDGMVLRHGAAKEAITPYYFSLEDLQEDWQQTTTATTTANKPDITVNDFAEVFCLSKGITRDHLQSEEEGMEGMIEQNHPLHNPGIVPPRREINMLKKFYRHQGFIPGEYSKTKFIPPAQQ